MLLIDVLRGLAMFGVLWSNLNDWYGGIDSRSWIENALGGIQEFSIESRFYSLLGFLFGMGFAIQMSRADARGADARAMYCRRLGVLLAIGIAHGTLIWHGDILTAYALLGFVLILFRRASPRWLLIAAAANLVLVPVLLTTALGAMGVKYSAPPTPEQIGWIYEHGSLAQIMAEGQRAYFYWYRRWPAVVFPPFLSLFLLGLWAVRVDLLKRITARRSTIVKVLRISIAASVAAVLLSVVLGHLWPEPGTGLNPGGAHFYLQALRNASFQILAHLTIWPGAAAYAAAMALAASYPSSARRLEPLAAVGRMSLTTYLMQSLISVGLFYHYGLGLYNHAGYTGKLGITCAVFAAQMAASTWWLRRYRFGPMEWAWRSAAYGKMQPMRRLS